MMMELEKQRTTRRSVEIHAALSEIMWKGSTNLLNDNQNKSSIYILPYNAVRHKKADTPSVASYQSLVSDHLLDINERPKTVPVLPSELRFFTPNSSIRSRDSPSALLSTASTRVGFGSGARGPHPFPLTDTASDAMSNSRFIAERRNIPMAKLLERTGTVKFDSSESVANSSFKGYTPSGGRRTLGTASAMRLTQTLTEQLERDNASLQSQGIGGDYSLRVVHI